MKRGDQVAEFELPDQTGIVENSRSCSPTAPSCCSLPGGDDCRLHQGSLPLPRPRVGVRRCRRQPVGISTDPVEKQAQFAEKQSFDYPLLSDADGTVATQFGVKRGLLGKFMPVKRTTFVIDSDRTVLEVIASEVSMDTHADKALEVLRQRQSA